MKVKGFCFSTLATAIGFGFWCQISVFLGLLFVFCLVGQTLTPVGGLTVMMAGSQVPPNSLFVSPLHLP